jgi:hypothetical protein
MWAELAGRLTVVVVPSVWMSPRITLAMAAAPRILIPIEEGIHGLGVEATAEKPMTALMSPERLDFQFVVK